MSSGTLSGILKTLNLIFVNLNIQISYYSLSLVSFQIVWRKTYRFISIIFLNILNTFVELCLYWNEVMICKLKSELWFILKATPENMHTTARQNGIPTIKRHIKRLVKCKTEEIVKGFSISEIYYHKSWFKAHHDTWYNT